VRHDLDRLRDILEAIEAIDRYCAQGKARYEAEELVRVWCLRHIEIVGEAVARLTDELKARHPLQPWRDIVAMRNILIHGYFDIDWEAVWTVVERDLPPLRKAVETILSLEPPDS
jgi:uncharacterized protein with HEPN domain